MNKLQFFKSLQTIENTELYSLRSFAEAAKQVDSKLTYRTIRARLRSPKLAHLFTAVGNDIGFEPRSLVVIVSIALKDAMQVIDVNATGAASMAVDAANSTLKQCLLETRALSSGSKVIENTVHTFPLRHLIPATNNMAQVNNAAVKLSTKTTKVTHFRAFANLKNVFAREHFEGEMLESIASEIVLFKNVASRVWNALEWDRRDINQCDFDEFMETQVMPLYWKLPLEWRMDTTESIPEQYREHLADHSRLVYFEGQYPIAMAALPYACKLVIDAIKSLGYKVWEETVEEVMREACALAGAELESEEQIEAQAVKSLHPTTAAYNADEQSKVMINERVDFVSWQPYMLEGHLLATSHGLVRADNVIDNMAMFYIANELDLVEAKHAVLKSEQFKHWTGSVATEFAAINASSLPNFTAALVHELEAKGKRINYVALTTFMQEVLTAATCCITGEYYRLSTNEVIDACTNFSVQGCSPMALARRDELVNKFMVQWEDGVRLFPNDVQDLQQCLDLIEATVNAHEVEEEVAKEAEHGVEWSASSGDFGQVPYEEYVDFSIDPREEARLEREMGISDDEKDLGFVYDPEHGVFPFNLIDDNGEPIAHLPGQELNVPSTEQATA